MTDGATWGRRTLVAAVIAVIAAVFSLFTLTAGSRPASAAPATPGAIVGIYGKCLDVKDGSSSNGAPVQTYKCHGGANQEWTVMPGPTGDTLRSLGKCLSVSGNGTKSGTPVVLWDCDGKAGQDWFWIPVYYGELINPASGDCLSASVLSRSGGLQLSINDCGKGASEAWQLPS